MGIIFFNRLLIFWKLNPTTKWWKYNYRATTTVESLIELESAQGNFSF